MIFFRNIMLKSGSSCAIINYKLQYNHNNALILIDESKACTYRLFGPVLLKKGTNV